MLLFVILAVLAIVPSGALIATLVMARSREKATRALHASEEKFAKIFRTSPDAINVAVRDSGVCLDLNQSYVKLFGYARDEVLGRSVLPGGLGIWVDPADRDRFNAALEAHGEVLGFEAPLRRKDGSLLTALISSCRMEIEGRPCNLSLTRDITERKQAEEALRESAQRLELAVQSGSLGVWDRNLVDDTVIWNERMYELCGLDRANFQPTNSYWREQILHPEDRPGLDALKEAAMAGGGSYRTDFRVLLPGGEIRYIGSTGLVIRDAAGRPVRMIGVNRDRTEQVKAESERRRAHEERVHSDKLESLGSLAGGMAHDMNNVLAGILGTAEMLRQQFPDGGPVARSLDNIVHAGGRGRDLVRALTDFARKGLEEPRLFDLNELLRKEVELLRHATLQKVEVVLDLDPLLPSVLGDPSALGGTIMNLAVNGLDAMPGGGTLSFRSRPHSSGRIALTVTDTGLGMAPEILARAVEPFFTTKPVGKGTGLGLARVYGTVKAHGGSVEMVSAPGEGTTVTLLLPCFQQGRSEAPEPEPRDDTGALRILLVDDDPVIRDTMPPMLESMGHRVDTASLGREALNRLKAGLQVDLVILDHNMPGLSGTETLVRLREIQPELPVVLVTGFVDAFTENLLTSYPRVWILKKPCSMKEIRNALATAIAAATVVI